MAIESITNKIQGQQILEQGVDLQSSGLQSSKAPAPLLGGDSVKVTSGAMTDLEKLVARLKNESENTRQSVSQRRISILQTILDSMASTITATERENLLELEKLNGQKSEAESELAKLQGAKTAADGRIAVLDVQIEALEKAIEQAVKDGAEHREQVAKLKEQRAEEQAELDRIEGAIKSASSKIADIDGKIAECTKAIGSATLSKVSAALRAASSDDDAGEGESLETQAERDKKDAKEIEYNISRRISEALDKIDEQIRRVLDEAQMKVEG